MNSDFRQLKDKAAARLFTKYPALVENLLSEYDGIEEVAVVGRPDDYWGEVAVAVGAAGEVTTVVAGGAPAGTLFLAASHNSLSRSRAAFIGDTHLQSFIF